MNSSDWWRGRVESLAPLALGTPTPPSEEPSSSRPHATVVIVEDDDDSRETLKVLLSVSGHSVYEADDGLVGVEVIRHTNPDVALIDVGLPRCDGYEVARRLRSMPECRHVFLVAMTGYGSPEDRDHAREAGFDMHTVKPIDVDELRAVIAAIGGRAAESPSRRSV